MTLPGFPAATFFPPQFIKLVSSDAFPGANSTIPEDVQDGDIALGASWAIGSITNEGDWTKVAPIIGNTSGYLCGYYKVLTESDRGVAYSLLNASTNRTHVRSIYRPSRGVWGPPESITSDFQPSLPYSNTILGANVPCLVAFDAIRFGIADITPSRPPKVTETATDNLSHLVWYFSRDAPNISVSYDNNTSASYGVLSYRIPLNL